MIDLAALFQAASAEHSATEISGFPVSGGSEPEEQVIDNKHISGISGISGRPEWAKQKPEPEFLQARVRERAGERARDPYVGDPETPETPEKPMPAGRCLSGSLSLNPEKERETGNVWPLPAPFIGITPPTFDERAAFLEYECNLCRAEAEAQARAEITEVATVSPPPAPQPTTALLPAVDGLALWRAGLARLRPDRLPCPDYRPGEWAQVYARALSFLDQFGEQAEALGWTAVRLFGVHHKAGTVRVDACGGLVLGTGGAVRAITDAEIQFGHLTHRKKLVQPEGVPLWLFQPPEQSQVRVRASVQESLNPWDPPVPWGPVRARASDQESVNPWEPPVPWEPSDPPLF